MRYSLIYPGLQFSYIIKFILFNKVLFIFGGDILIHLIANICDAKLL